MYNLLQTHNLPKGFLLTCPLSASTRRIPILRRVLQMKDVGNPPGLSLGNTGGTASFQGTPTQALWASAKSPASFLKNKGHSN